MSTSSRWRSSRRRRTSYSSPRRRVAEGDPQQEAVELGLGQRVGALVLHRVGGRQHVERARQPVGLALDGHLALLHRLEQRGLGLGRRAVDLVGQQQPGEDRPRPEVELGAPLVVDVGPGQVGRQQVRGELRAGEVQAERPRERARRQRLAQAREVLEQDVALGEDRRPAPGSAPRACRRRRDRPRPGRPRRTVATLEASGRGFGVSHGLPRFGSGCGRSRRATAGVRGRARARGASARSGSRARASADQPVAARRPRARSACWWLDRMRRSEVASSTRSPTSGQRGIPLRGRRVDGVEDQPDQRQRPRPWRRRTARAGARSRAARRRRSSPRRGPRRRAAGRASPARHARRLTGAPPGCGGSRASASSAAARCSSVIGCSENRASR